MTGDRDSAPNHGVRLSGQLDATTVPGLLEQVDAWLARPSPEIDLAGVERADSAGVALLLEIQRRARRAGREVHFRNAPDQMRAIIGFCALDRVLAVS